MTVAPYRAEPPEVTTIQQTGKSLKLEMLLSVMVIAIGTIWLVVAMMGAAERAEASPGVTDSDMSEAYAALLLMAGVIWHFITRLRIWWHHK